MPFVRQARGSPPGAVAAKFRCRISRSLQVRLSTLRVSRIGQAARMSNAGGNAFRSFGAKRRNLYYKPARGSAGVHRSSMCANRAMRRWLLALESLCENSRFATRGLDPRLRGDDVAGVRSCIQRSHSREACPRVGGER